MAMHTLTADVRPAKMIAVYGIFSALLDRYRQQVSDLDEAEDQGAIDRLANASQGTLEYLVRTRVRSTAALADKIDALVERYGKDGAIPVELVRELLLDAYHLTSETGLTLAWVHLWHDLGCHLYLQGDKGVRHFGMPEPPRYEGHYSASLPECLKIRGEAEARGATKALQVLLRMGGKRAEDGIFAFATQVGEGPTNGN